MKIHDISMEISEKMPFIREGTKRPVFKTVNNLKSACPMKQVWILICTQEPIWMPLYIW